MVPSKLNIKSVLFQIGTLSLRRSETKNLKIFIIDNFFSCHLMVSKLCTVIKPGNT